MMITDQGAQKKCAFGGCLLAQIKPVFSLPPSLSEVRTRCEQTQQTGEFVFAVAHGGHMLVIDWRSCKSRLWLHSILCVLLQVLWLRELRSGLHEEGRRADSAVGLIVYFLFHKSMHKRRCLSRTFDSNPLFNEATEASVISISYHPHPLLYGDPHNSSTNS